MRLRFQYWWKAGFMQRIGERIEVMHQRFATGDVLAIRPGYALAPDTISSIDCNGCFACFPTAFLHRTKHSLHRNRQGERKEISSLSLMIAFALIMYRRLPLQDIELYL